MSNDNSSFEQILKMLQDLTDRVVVLEAGHGASDSRKKGETRKKPMSARELLKLYKADKHVDKTLILGSFLENFQGMSSFSRDDLKKAFYSSKLTLPSNINDQVNMNIKKGYMMAVSEKKNKKTAWMLTDLGERRLEDMKKDTKPLSIK